MDIQFHSSIHETVAGDEQKKTIPNMSGLVVPSTSLLSLQLKFHTTQSRHETARSKTKENPKGVRGIQSAIESYSSNRSLSLVTKPGGVSLARADQ
jgi:hypothetical protein